MLNSFYAGLLFCTHLSSKQDPKTFNSPMVQRSCLFRASDRMQTYNQTLTKPLSSTHETIDIVFILHWSVTIV